MKFHPPTEDIELSASDLAKVKAVTKRGTCTTIRNYDIAKKERWGA